MMTEQQTQECWGVVMRVLAQKHPTPPNPHISVTRLIGAITLLVPLALTPGDRQTQAGLFSGSPAQAEELQPYAQNGGITQSQIDNLNRSYARQQSYRAIQSLRRRGELGSPNYVSQFREVYEIRGSGDPYRAPGKFHILYRPSPSCNYRCSEAYDWYRQ